MSKPKTKAVPAAKMPAARPVAANLPAENAAPMWQYALVILLPLVAWGRSVGFGFSYHDDDKMILDKAQTLAQGFRWSNIFGTDAWMMKQQIELYRPWQTLTYVLDYQLAGGSSPSIFHAHNVLIFALNSLLFFLLLRRLFPVGTAAFWGALLYPLNFLFTHVVAWVPARGDLYLFTFGVLCLLTFLDFVQKQKTPALFASALFFFLALLAKESAVMLLPIMGVIGWANRAKMRLTGAIWGWAAVVGGSLAWYLALRKAAISTASAKFEASAVFSNARTVFEELAKFFLPLKFSVMPAFDLALTLIGLALAAVLGWLVLRNRAKMRPEILLLGLALWIFPYLPSLGYRPQFTGFAYDYLDHRAYFVLTGLWVIVLELAVSSGFFEQKWAKTAAIGVGAYFAAFGFFNLNTYRDWQAFYQNATETNPASGLAASNLGTQLAVAGKNAEALAWFEKARSINPKDADTHTRIAEMLVKLGRHAEAIPEATAALSGANFFRSKALGLRGVAYGATKRFDLALADFQEASKIAPTEPEHWRNAGACLKDMGRHAEAIAPLDRAIEVNPNYVEAYFDRGFCYGALQKFAEARADMGKAIQLNPNYGAAWFFKGRAGLALGDRTGACADFARAKELGIPDAAGFLQANCGGQ